MLQKISKVNNDKNAPIGIFDSGIGGLSVLQTIKKLLPKEKIIYYADNLYAPYGEKTNAFIENRGISIAKWLIKEKSCKALVIACNTASAYITENLRELFSIPIIAIEPGIKPATILSKKKMIGVLATAATLRSQKYISLHKQYETNCRVLTLEGNNLVIYVENGLIESNSSINLIKKCCDYFIDAGVDSLVLGCTHYIFLKEFFTKISDGKLMLIDTSEAIANQLKNNLNKLGLEICCDSERIPNREPLVKIITSGNAEKFSLVASTLLKKSYLAKQESIN